MKLFKNKIIKKKKDRMLSWKQIKNSKAKLYNTQKNMFRMIPSCCFKFLPKHIGTRTIPTWSSNSILRTIKWYIHCQSPYKTSISNKSAHKKALKCLTFLKRLPDNFRKERKEWRSQRQYMNRARQAFGYLSATIRNSIEWIWQYFLYCCKSKTLICIIEMVIWHTIQPGTMELLAFVDFTKKFFLKVLYKELLIPPNILYIFVFIYFHISCQV